MAVTLPQDDWERLLERITAKSLTSTAHKKRLRSIPRGEGPTDMFTMTVKQTARRKMPEIDDRAQAIEFTNQVMIDAIYAAAEELGQDGWTLLAKAGLGHLVFARQKLYEGASIEEMSTLTDQEKAAIRSKLSELAPATKPRAGMTLTRTSLRAGPGTQYEVLEALPPQTRFQVLDGKDTWLRVTALDKEGYVHRGFVVLDGEAGLTGFLRLRPELAEIPLEAPESEAIVLEADAVNPAAKAVAEVWNRYGGLLAVLAHELRIDPAAAVAVFVTEAPCGRGFADDGRMIIRFENHVFFHEWGKRDPDRFSEHFMFDAQKQWQGHRWRPSPDQPWRDFHGDQSAEWKVFQFACSLDDGAAKRSISMGAPQIMGFNYAALGYESVQEMFEAFSASERNQILGFFDFIKGSLANSRPIQALQQQDFNTFAAFYNGPGQAALYGGLIESRIQLFHSLRAGEPLPRSIPDLPPSALEETPAECEAARPRSFDHDPELYATWRDHVREGFAQNSQMFRRALKSLMASYRASVWAYRILLGVATASFLAGIGLSLWRGSAGFGLVFGGLGIAVFLIYFLSRPSWGLGENLELITWLGVVYNTYWARVVRLVNADAEQEELEHVQRDAVAEIQRIMDRRTKMRS